MELRDLLSIRSLIVQVSCLGKAFVCSNRILTWLVAEDVQVSYLILSDPQGSQQMRGRKTGVLSVARGRGKHPNLTRF
ncbi:hypothetical protein OUZ56_012800 [Daphnia magna]|uniref:Uncharacterized protein n=1 Tax=Daphnia magna TaxID=35525 RepID=A0ABQ9Z441_9CRUS|nr:hypothetical protein OUZ56_012800 [Daphnia magna]